MKRLRNGPDREFQNVSHEAHDRNELLDVVKEVGCAAASCTAHARCGEYDGRISYRRGSGWRGDNSRQSESANSRRGIPSTATSSQAKQQTKNDWTHPHFNPFPPHNFKYNYTASRQIENSPGNAIPLMNSQAIFQQIAEIKAGNPLPQLSLLRVGFSHSQRCGV